MILISNNKISRIVWALTVFFVVFLSTFQYAQAQESQSLSVSPTLFEMSANPGQLWKSSIKVINSNPYDLTVYANVVNFAPQGETGHGKLMPVFEEMTGGATLAEWVVIASGPNIIEQEKSISIPFVVEVPEDASPGGYFAAILISTQPPKVEGEVLQLRTAQIVTSLLFVRIAGDVNESGSIRTFTTADIFHQTPETVLELRFENKGNVHLQPRGDITIYNMWGKERGLIPINNRTHFGNVLPESIRKFEFTWKGEQSISDIGRYKAIATLAYGFGDQKFITASTHFWVVPLKSLLITLGSFITLVLLVSWCIKLYVRRMLQMAGVEPASYRERKNSSHAIEDAEGDVRIASYKSISAPVRYGYLDLRTRLFEAKAFFGVIQTLYTFVVSYKLFFAGVVVIIAGLISAYYFIADVTIEEKEYDVTIANPDLNLNLSSEEITYAELAASQNLAALDDIADQDFTLNMINTSGEPGTAASVAASLANDGYGISSLDSGEGRLDKRSVIVFDPALQETALQLSKKLSGAIVSGRAASSTDPIPNITIYVGADQVVD
ncbi:MAG: hypothetical protein ACI9VM_000135 [Candidatus Azotimanducaceae bacterium]|jgi:hypothetical protein